jgi:hypothetical protein
MLTGYNVQQPSMSSSKSIRRSLAAPGAARSHASRADGPGRRRGWLAQAVLLTLAFLLHTGRASAASSANAELALCEFADISVAAGPGACAAAENGVAGSAEDAEGSDAAAHGAPMCDNAAASIAALPEVPEVDRGQFEPARCDIQHLLALLNSDDRVGSANVISGNGREKPAPPPIRLQQERLDAAFAGGQPWPVPRAPSIVAFEAPRGLGWLLGHNARIERPPSQR